jgi:hypothetical protein
VATLAYLAKRPLARPVYNSTSVANPKIMSRVEPNKRRPGRGLEVWCKGSMVILLRLICTRETYC